jgi:hypothetical protein
MAMTDETDLAEQRDVAVSKFLRLKPLERELTQRALTCLLGKPQSYVTNIEVGQRRCAVSDFLAFADPYTSTCAAWLHRVPWRGSRANHATRWSANAAVQLRRLEIARAAGNCRGAPAVNHRQQLPVERAIVQ